MVCVDFRPFKAQLTFRLGVRSKNTGNHRPRRRRCNCRSERRPVCSRRSRQQQPQRVRQRLHRRRDNGLAGCGANRTQSNDTSKRRRDQIEPPSGPSPTTTARDLELAESHHGDRLCRAARAPCLLPGIVATSRPPRCRNTSNGGDPNARRAYHSSGCHRGGNEYIRR